MLPGQVSHQASQGDEAVEDGLNQPVIANQPEVLPGQLGHPAALHVLRRGEQLLLADLQNRADILQQRDVGIGQPPLPLAHGGIGDEQLLGKFLLGHSQLFAALEDVRAEGLFTFHLHPLLLGSVPCKTACIIEPAGQKVKKIRDISRSTVGKVPDLFVFNPLRPYFINLSMAEQRSSRACSSPSSTASTMQWRM